MIYVAALREVWTRLELQARPVDAGNDKPNGLLDGLKVKPNGEYRIDGEKDLPQVTMTELGIKDSVGRTDGRITLFVKTSRKNGWVSMDPTQKDGLYNWVEKVMDAIEISPSTGESDTLLTLHRKDGTPLLKGGHPIQLLSEQFTTECRMSEINDLSFVAEIDIIFGIANGRRANRRSAPVTNADYTE